MGYRNRIVTSLKPTYVGVKFSDKTNLNIMKFIKENKIKNYTDPDAFHATVVYSKTPCWGFPSVGRLETPVIIKYKGDKTDRSFAIFGKNEDSLVVKLISPWLVKRHKLTLLYGAEPTYPDYNPHITLSYNFIDKDRLPFLPKMTFDIEIIEEYMEPINENWA